MTTPAWVHEVVGDWRPRERLGGNEWAERFRILSRDESPSPGPWRSVPWQRELLDALADPLIVWLVVLKAAQMGVSELLRCAVARWAVLDPGDVLWVMTTQDAAEASMRKLWAMFKATPALHSLVSPRKADSRLLQMVLTNGMKITIGWSGSPQSMASDPQRYVILDEVAKYATMGKGGEADAVSFAGERTKVYGRRGKRILLSSPKHDDDLIMKNHRETEDRRVFAIPCPAPECGKLQPLAWQSVRWDGGEPSTAPAEAEVRIKLASEVEKTQEAWMECSGCAGKIDTMRGARDPRATWIQEDGSVAGGNRRAYHVDELLHWETTLASLAGKFLRCVTPIQLQGFYNGSLGTTFRVELSLIAASLFEARAIYPARLVPSWATTVIATADTQLRGWWWLVRAWGQGGRSRLLDWGWAEGVDELTERAIDVWYPVEGDEKARARPFVFAVDTGGGMLTPDGSRTKEVYSLVLKVGVRAAAIKGEADLESLQGTPWRTRKVKVSHERFGERDIDLNLVNKNYYADELSSLVRCVEPIKWEECVAAQDAAYARQMASEQKVLLTTQTGSKWLWQKRSKHAQNHMWDCSRYQVWAAEFCRVEDRQWPTWAGTSGAAKLRTAAEDEEAAEPRTPWIVGRD